MANSLLEAKNSHSRGVTPSLPPLPSRGRPARALRLEWLDAVEQLMLDGVGSPSEMASVTGLTRATSARWMKEVQNIWADASHRRLADTRREALFHQADSVAKAAWSQLTNEAHPFVICALLRVVLEAHDRKARLLGL